MGRARAGGAATRRLVRGEGRYWLVIALVALSGLVGIKNVSSIVTTGAPRIAVDMRVSGNAYSSMFVNEGSNVQVTPVVANVRQTYTYPFDGDVGYLVLGPVNAPGITVEIFGIRAVNDGGVVASFEPDQLAAWTVSGMTPISADSEAIRWRTDGRGAAISSIVDIQLGVSQRADLVAALRDPLALTVFAFAAGLFVLASWMSTRRSRVVALALIASILPLATLVYPEAQVVDPIPGTTAAVGNAALLGYGYSGRQVASVLILLALLAIGIASSHVARRRADSPSPIDPGELSEPQSHPSRSAWVGLAVVGIAALALLPDLRSGIDVARYGQFPASAFDADNSLTWQWLSSTGAVPMRDFWYPYGFAYVYRASLLVGPLVEYFVALLVLAGLGRAVWVLAGRRWWPPIAVVGLAVVAFPADLTRYVISVVVALLYAGRDRTRESFQVGDLLFGLAATVGVFTEPALVGYAVVGVVAVVIIDVVEQRRRSWGSWARRIARELFVPVVGAALYFGTLLANHQFTETVAFYRAFSAQAAYSGSPLDLDRALSDPLSAGWLVLIAPVVFVALGAFMYARAEARLKGAGLYMLVVGAVAFAMLQKHLLRPAPSILLFTVLLGVVGAVAIAWHQQGWYRAVGAGLVLGLVVSVVTVGPTLSAAWTRIRSLPDRVWNDGAVVLLHRDQVQRASEVRFDRRHFDQLPGERAVARTLRPSLEGTRRGLFVLTNSPMLYMLLDQLPPWHTNTYNMSPVREQQRVLDVLADHRPRAVVWTPTDAVFDSVQDVVRIPAVYRYVMRRFVPDQTRAGFDLLVPRGNAPFAFDYWTTSLGRVAELGGIAAVTELPQSESCHDGTRSCGTFLRLRLTEPLAGGTSIDVPVSVDGQPFTIRMRATDNESDYVVRLDRVWFWGVAQAEGLAVEVTRPPGSPWRAVVVSRRVNSDDLY